MTSHCIENKSKVPLPGPGALRDLPLASCPTWSLSSLSESGPSDLLSSLAQPNPLPTQGLAPVVSRCVFCRGRSSSRPSRAASCSPFWSRLECHPLGDLFPDPSSKVQPSSLCITSLSAPREQKLCENGVINSCLLHFQQSEHCQALGPRSRNICEMNEWKSTWETCWGQLLSLACA